MEDFVAKKKAEMRRSKRRENMIAFAMISPYCIIFVLFTLVPFLLGFIFSFMRYNPYMPDENEFLGFQNYLNIFNFDLPISKSFWNSFIRRESE